MQTPLLRNGQILMKDAHSAESNENCIFRFLFFKIWLIVFTIYGDTPGFSSVSPTKKKTFIRGQIYRKYGVCLGMGEKPFFLNPVLKQGKKNKKCFFSSYFYDFFNEKCT